MIRILHEIRDPIHAFVRVDSSEREVVNSRPFQRLRHIQQLAMTSFVYPGATHTRFEHSLGVMELASRVYDVVTNPENVVKEVRELLEPLGNPDKRTYYRRVLRMAALCHDMGHLPFSHAGEKNLLPEGVDHEDLTLSIIQSDELADVWKSITPPVRPEDIAKVAVGPKKLRQCKFSDWETILAEIIVGDAFGVDRMDYLLRDSHHAGVAYGKFDHYRLIDTLRILPAAQRNGETKSLEPALGMEEGGIQSAEALMLARYLMYSQVYFHRIRRIYDIHLTDFLREWLTDGQFSQVVEEHLKLTDNEIMTALWNAAFNAENKGHLHARRIICRQHFKQLYDRNPEDVNINPEAGNAIAKALTNEFGERCLRHDIYRQKGGAPFFPVLMRNEMIVGSLAISKPLENVPVVSIDRIFVEREVFPKAKNFLDQRHSDIIRPEEEGNSQDDQNE